MQRWVIDQTARREHVDRIKRAAPTYWSNVLTTLQHDIDYFNEKIGGDELTLVTSGGFSAQVVRGEGCVLFDMHPHTGRISYARVGETGSTGTIEEPTLDDDGLNLLPPSGSYDLICERILGPVLPKS